VVGVGLAFDRDGKRGDGNGDAAAANLQRVLELMS